MGSKENCGSKKEYELVAPDGGWGYLICVGAIVIFSVTSGFLPSFGIIYKDLIEEIGMGLTQINLITGINALSVAFSGFLTSALLNHFSKRQLAFISITLFNLGTVLMVFVKSVITFASFLIIQGAGLGVLFNLTFTILNDYFVEKLLFAVSVVQTLTAATVMFLPQYVNFVYELYGYRGTILMTTGVCMQGFVAVALFQPISIHMKKVKTKPVVDEMQVLLPNGEDVPTIKLNDLESLDKASIDNHSELWNDDIQKSSAIVNVFKEIFDIPVMKTMIKSNVSWGNAFYMIGDITFSILLPQALYADGWTDDVVALSVTLLSFGDLAGRIFFALFSKWIRLGSQDITVIGLFISLVSKTGYLLFSTNRIMSLVFITISGVSRSILILFGSLIINDVIGTEKFASAMGFNMMLMAILNLGFGPCFGVIRDYTGSYRFTIWAIVILTALAFVSWSAELLYKRWHLGKKNKQLERK